MSGRALAAALLLVGPDAARPDEEMGPLYLAALPVEAPAGLALQAGPLRVALDLHPGAGAKAASLREWFPGAEGSGDRVELVVDGLPRGRSPAGPEHLRASFLVDFDEPGFAPLREELRSLPGPDPAGASLARLADRWIARKSMRRVFDAASAVASRREGDCTEHAVLLAALARMQGRPARVVLGIALADVGGRVAALGHAWTEVHDGTRWATADATGLPADRVLYLPTAVMADEGPGHLLRLMAQLSPLDVRRVTLGPAAAPAPAAR